MSGAVASEGELNSIVQEYLSYHGFEKAVGAFERECAEKGRPVSSSEVRPKTGQRLTNIQHEMIEMYDGGNGRPFFELWMKHLPPDIYDNDPVAQKLEFLLNVYFTTYPIKNGINDEESTVRFRKYLETRGNELSHAPEFVPYCALAFVRDPKQIPSFSDIFSDTWTENLKKRLQKFLSLTLRSKPQPRLVDLFQGNAKSRDSQVLEQRVKESEKMTELFRKRCTKVQGDYYNLIDVTANLVDTLESCIEGKPVALDYIPQICNRLFAQDVRQTMDFSRPGTAAKVLRDTAALHPLTNRTNADGNLNSNLDFNKIKLDLASANERKRALLLQALRWKLTKVSYADRVTSISAFRTNDLIGCTTLGPHRQAVFDMLSGQSNLLRQYVARLLNAISSAWEGRGYLALSNDLVLELIKGVQRSSHDPLSQEHMLACLQKLSLRSMLRPMMINEGLNGWLVSILKVPDSLSDYMLEYAIALLMNLTVQSYGREKCKPHGSQLLKIISNLLGHENLNIKPFVHGTLFSLLRVPSIREEAVAMGMEDILKSSVKDDDEQEKRHIQFLLKRLQNSDDLEKSSSDSDDDDDDDDVYDEDQEELEKDLDNNEILRPQNGEPSGNQFLAKYYLVSGVPRDMKNKHHDNFLANDDILRRPVTPSFFRSATGEHRNPVGDSIARMAYQSAPPTERIINDNRRPPTRSGSRPSSSDNVIQRAAPRAVTPGQSVGNFPFASRPKLPRTPDRPSSRGHDVPTPPQIRYSDSLPRPGSGGRPSSQPSPRLK